MSEPAPVHGTCDPRFQRVRDVFEQNLEAGVDLGASVAFTLDGELVVDLWGGHLDFDRKDEWQRDTLVNLYSTTKGMTAICAHRLIEQGKLDLNAPVARYWPEFAAADKQELPVRYLLSHQAGLPAIRKTLPKNSLYDWNAMTSALAEQEPWWEPGAKHGYHAMTYGFLVGELVRRISGQSLGTYFREHIADPLERRLPHRHARGARRTDVEAARPAGIAQPGRQAEAARQPARADPTVHAGHDRSEPRSRARPSSIRRRTAAPSILAPGGQLRSLPPTATAPHAAWHGSTAALARGGEVDGVRILEPETIDNAISEQAFGPDAVLGGLPMRFGLGFMLRQDFMPLSPSPRAFGHPGAGGSIGMADPDARVGFGYTLNKMQQGLVGGAGGFAMISRLLRRLSDAPAQTRALGPT